MTPKKKINLLIGVSFLLIQFYSANTESIREAKNVCRDGDKIGVAGDCKKYMECESGTFVSKECDQSDPEIQFVFDTKTKECKDSHFNHTCQECDEGQKEGVVNKCTIYTECVNNTRVNHTCPDNLNFDVVSQSCKVEGEAVCLCKAPTKRNCTEEESKLCGVGAICEVVDDKAECSCKPGTDGDPYNKCCAKPLTCGCWGDPHCRTFDGRNFDFMGACKYDLVSTNCFNRTLAPGLVPFEIKQKHHTNGRKHSKVSFVEYVQVNVYGKEYRLVSRNTFTVDGERTNTPFKDNDNGKVQVFASGRRSLALSTDFGLTVSFDGNAVKVTLCDAYENSLCGLCGNADGNKTVENEFVDKENKPVVHKGDDHKAIFKWGSIWKTPTDDDRDRDIDQTLCNSTEVSEGPGDKDTCSNDYTMSQYCGILNDLKGPWKQCIEKMDKEKLDAIVNACVFDLCSYEGDSQQDELRCKIMEEFNKECLALSQQINRPWAFDWREKTECPIKCGENEVYEVREECPKTCLNPDGEYDCGQKVRAEDCFCKDGYVMNEHGQCIDERECDDKPRECTAEENNCGVGADCMILGNQTQCTCPKKHKGDPHVRCCYKELSCSCWGDPHCHTFDKRSFDFQGACKYDLISTDCHNKTLAPGLVPFNVKQMHGTRGKHPKTSFVEYVEVNVDGVQYRLIGSRNRFTRNGVRKSTPFTDTNKVQVYTRSKKIVLSTEFGLTVTFDEKHKHSVKLCDAYANNVCGLCGNADGNKDYDNEFVDRENRPVPIKGHKHTKYFKWGTEWIVPTDNSKDRDIDNSLCSSSVKDPTVEPPIVECVGNYEDSENCGKLNSSVSDSWASCIEEMDYDKLNSMVEGCALDLCAYENTTFLQELRCSAFEEFNRECLALAQELGKPWDKFELDWRNKTNCPMECGQNEEYAIRDECPKTCLYPDGRYDCGSLDPIEGCYCKVGFVLNSFGKCIKVDACDVQAECKFEGDKSAIAGDCNKYQECHDGKLVNKTCEDVEFPSFDIVSNECKESSVATCMEKPVPQVLCKSTLDQNSNMTGYCTDVSLCVGAAIKGNCSSESICCIEDAAELAAMRSFDLQDDTLTKAVFLKISGNTKRNAALYKYFVQAIRMANVTSTYAKSAFLAQMLGETNKFTSIESIIDEKDFNPDIGNNDTGDGRKFRGRGAILIRGKTNYNLAQVKSKLNLPYDVFTEPETVAYPSVAFPLAAWFWNSNAYPATKANVSVTEPTDLNLLADGSFMGFTQITHALTSRLSSLKERAAFNEDILREIGFAPLARGSGDECELKNGDKGYAVPICLLDFKRSYCGCEGQYEVRSCPYGKNSKGKCRNSATIKCCVEKVECKTYLDLVVIIDSSASVNAEDPENFEKVKTFIEDLVRSQDVGLNKTRISIINYSRNATVLNSLEEGTSHEKLLKIVKSLKFLNGSTNTAQALRFANEQLDEALGMRHKRAGMPRVVVTITDGLSNTDKDLTIPEANKLKRREINLVGVGIGAEIANNATELLALASSAYDMFYVPNFDKLKSILRELTTTTCQQAAPLYQGEDAVVQQVQKDTYKYYTYKTSKKSRSTSSESYFEIKLRVLRGDSELYWSFDESDTKPKSESDYVGMEAYQDDSEPVSNYIPEEARSQRVERSAAAPTVKTYEAVDATNQGTLYLTVKGLTDGDNQFEINVESKIRVFNSGLCLASGHAIFVTLLVAIFTRSFNF